jgi:hypothetical protein
VRVVGSGNPAAAPAGPAGHDDYHESFWRGMLHFAGRFGALLLLN